MDAVVLCATMNEIFATIAVASGLPSIAKKMLQKLRQNSASISTLALINGIESMSLHLPNHLPQQQQIPAMASFGPPFVLTARDHFAMHIAGHLAGLTGDFEMSNSVIASVSYELAEEMIRHKIKTDQAFMDEIRQLLEVQKKEHQS
ncbi:MAG: hypothetical protein KDD44_03935 [Bdellovibrionales bacterium]|nr:hypothetical protein [Bdellovibrionales bacterium]